MKAAVIFLFLAFASQIAQAQSKAQKNLPLSLRAQQCAMDAAAYHRVNPQILMAIALVESSGRPDVIGRNKNQTIDVGLMGVNSIHFQNLVSKGVTPNNLMNECVSMYVAAWLYSHQVFKYGNTWKAVGAYHSRTPSLNEKYQFRVMSKLVEMGILVAAK